jgi:RNA-directed DNA polymerase
MYALRKVRSSAKKNAKSFLAKVRKIVRINSDKKTEELIKQLNPVIRGWANYHRHIVASKTFSYVDYNIFKCLWRWAKRRHPQKGNLWTSTERESMDQKEILLQRLS